MRMFRNNTMGPRDGSEIVILHSLSPPFWTQFSVNSGLPRWRIILGCWSKLDHRFPDETALASEGAFVP